MNKPNILITGANGFIGSYLVEMALERGMNVFAAIRPTSNKQYLTDIRITLVEIDFTSPVSIAATLKGINNRFGSIDYVVHIAGTTKANCEGDYIKVNANFTQNLIIALADSELTVNKFVFISSLAAVGPGNPDGLAPVNINHTPKPITGYGRSKLLAEEHIRKQCVLPWIILRPTVVYGPREHELFTLFKMINFHLQPVIKNKKQKLSFIHVTDLSRAILDLATSEIERKTYFISDGNAYSSNALSEYIKAHLQKRTLKLPVTKPFLVLISSMLELLYSAGSKTPTLNKEKVMEMNSINWICDIEPLENDIAFKPQYNLQDGLKQTILWYGSNGWLKTRNKDLQRR